MKLNILFRIDAGGEVGLGHYYRSLDLAFRLKEIGHYVIFTHIVSDFWEAQNVNEFTFSNFPLNKGSEEAVMLKVIKNYNVDIFYVDGIIDFTKSFINKVKENARIVFYQNLASSRIFSDIFILPSIHHDSNFFKSFNNETKVFSGLKYFTFNPVIRKISRKENLRKKIRNIAVASGGSDPSNTLLMIYALVSSIDQPTINFNFFYGTNYIFKDRIPLHPMPNTRFKLFKHEEILKNDLLISSFGVSTYEFLYLGMPIISFGHKKSNAEASDIFAQKTNSLISLGLSDSVDKELLCKSIDQVKDLSFREGLMRSSKHLFDLNGVDRVVKIIEEN